MEASQGLAGPRIFETETMKAGRLWIFADIGRGILQLNDLTL
jgi:hypothetical protein